VHEFEEHARGVFGVEHLADPLVADAFADPLTPDAALLRAAAAGSRQAFALLVRRYEIAAYAWSTHALGSQVAAEVLTEELFRRAWAQAASAPPDVSRWLLEIAFDVAAEMGATHARADRDLDALWLGGLVKEALSHIGPDERSLLLAPTVTDDVAVRARTLNAMERLRALLRARSVARKPT
jgi:DNA-directed RNA polymerase specialized sigma24 family protein